MMSEDTRNATSSQAADCGQSHLALLDGLTSGRSGPAHARVSRSRSLAKEPVPMIHGICGPTSFGSSVPPGPLSSWENRLRGRLAMVGSTESPLIWKAKVSPQGRSISRLAPWTPPTSANASTGARWPTVKSSTGGADPNSRETGLSLQTYLSRWSTARASDGEKGSPNQSFGAGGEPLPAQMHKAHWVTASARDWKDTPGMSTVRPDGGSRLDQLPRQMVATAYMPTPTVADVQGGRKHRSGARANEPLLNGICHGATALSGQAPNGSSATTEKRGVPNPAFACWLMGFPDALTFGVLQAMQSFPRSRRKSSAR